MSMESVLLACTRSFVNFQSRPLVIAIALLIFDWKYLEMLEMFCKMFSTSFALLKAEENIKQEI